MIISPLESVAAEVRMESKQKIEIWAYDDRSDIRHGLPTLGRERLQIGEAYAADVAASLRHVIAEFERVLAETTETKPTLEIEAIELQFGVNASGSVALLGKLEAGMQAGIKVTLKRAKRE